jgi:hypothetical protein
MQDVQREAEEQFAWLLRRPSIMGRTLEQMEETVDLSRKLLTATLALAENELLPYTHIIDWNAASSETKQRLVESIPYIAGGLGLLDMEFYHNEAGLVPISVVRELIGAPVEYEGYLLTSATVILRYRRSNLPLS